MQEIFNITLELLQFLSGTGGTSGSAKIFLPDMLLLGSELMIIQLVLMNIGYFEHPLVIIVLMQLTVIS